MKFRYPVNYVAVTQKYKKGIHHGLDLGWNNKYGGKNQPIYAAADGVVCALKDNDKTNVGWGNYVKIDHGNNIYTLYAHLKQGIFVNIGQAVKQGEQIGIMDNTGHSFGNHLHFEIYEGGSSTKYKVDPLIRTYVYEGQIVSENADARDGLLYYKEESKEENIVNNANKNFEIGDKVLVLTGRATSGSDGSGSVTAEYHGIPEEGDVKYITLINKGAVRPYHLSNGPALGDRDRGWVSKEQIQKI